MPPLLPIASGGGSKKEVDFHPASSTEDEDETLSTPRKVHVNGHASGSSSGQNGKKRKANGEHGFKRAGAGIGTGTGPKARRLLAEKLYEVRQNLPFYQGRRMIIQEIMANETTIILGETGCGKSTQLPQLLRRHALSRDHYGHTSPSVGLNGHGDIKGKGKEAYTHTNGNATAGGSSSGPGPGPGPSVAITQPRRLPCISLARRVSEEMGCELGREVGFSVRFEEAMSAETRVRYMTEGVMMRELANASRPVVPRDQPTANVEKLTGTPAVESGITLQELNLLLRYDIIIIDEAHERTLNTDFLCGCLKKIQRIRQRLHSLGISMYGKPVMPLKLVIMSATLDPSKFQAFFETGKPPLLVKGRMYDVDTRHVVDPIDDFIEAAASQVMQIHCASPNRAGDILVFMPGSDEIETCVELLKRVTRDLPPGSMDLQVLPLYASLPPAAQIRIFSPLPPNTRRAIIATNIAETSLTIPGIVFVVDSGYKKEKDFIFRSSGPIEHLRKMGISKAAAWQRTGRAGRERDGLCYRLFTSEAFNALKSFDDPEIKRCNLSSAVLQLVAMGQNPFEFEYIDNPGKDSIAAAFQTLAGLGALDSPTSITPLGRSLLKYPLDPTHARILIASFGYACPSEIIDILSLVNAGNLYIDRASDRDSAAASRSKFIHRDGDHLTALNVFRAYLALKESSMTSKSDLTKWTKENHVNVRTLQSALKIRQQLRELAEKDGRDWKISCAAGGGGEMDNVGKSLLQGLFMNTAVIQPDGTYKQAAGSLIVKIHPSSVLMSKKVPAILYDELTITSAIYARNVSSFEQQWLAEVPWFKQAGTSVSALPDKTRL